MTKDPWDGDPLQPMSYNPWLYVYANPINLTDPSGRTPQGNPGLPPCIPIVVQAGLACAPVTIPPAPLPFCLPIVVQAGLPCIPVPCRVGPGVGWGPPGRGDGAGGEGMSDEDIVITRQDVSAAGSLKNYFMSESEVMIMTRVAMGENHVSFEDREYVMWVLKLRVELGFSNGRYRHAGDPLIRWGERTNVYRETIENPGQFEPIGNVLRDYNKLLSNYDPLWYCLNGAQNLCAMMHPHTQTQKQAFRTTYQSAQRIYTSSLHSMPSELKGYDQFAGVSGSANYYELGLSGRMLADKGNFYKDIFPGDNIYLGLVKCADVQNKNPNYILGEGLATLYVKDMTCPPGY